MYVSSTCKKSFPNPWVGYTSGVGLIQVILYSLGPRQIWPDLLYLCQILLLTVVLSSLLEEGTCLRRFFRGEKKNNEIGQSQKRQTDTKIHTISVYPLWLLAQVQTYTYNLQRFLSRKIWHVNVKYDAPSFILCGNGFTFKSADRIFHAYGNTSLQQVITNDYRWARCLFSA